MKKILALLIIIVLVMGGCGTMNKQETLTKEQQDNVVVQILRRYEKISEIKFLRFNRDSKTGFLHLSLEINNDESKRTTLSFSNYEYLNSSSGGGMSLNPVGRFAEFKREKSLADDEYVDFNVIKIVYLGE